MMKRFAALLPLLLLVACGDGTRDEAGLSADERQQLERAAEMLDTRTDTTPETEPEQPPAPFESE